MGLAIYGPAKDGENAIFRPQGLGEEGLSSQPVSNNVIFGPWQAANGNVIFGLYALSAGGYPTSKKKAKVAKRRTLTQEVAALAKSLEPAKKLTKTDKRKRRDEIVAEVIKQLPDVPNVEEVAPVIAQAVVRREAQLAALPASVGAPKQRTDIASVINQQIEKWRAKVRYDSHVDDESEIEMLLLE